MHRLARPPLLAACVLALGAVPATQPATQKAPAAYVLARTLKIDGPGPWNPWSSRPVTLDPDGKLLYVPRPKHTQVIDTASGKVLAEIHSPDPFAIALVPSAGRGFIANNRDNSVTVFDLHTYNVLGTIPVGDLPHAILYDPASKRVLVSCPGSKSIVAFPPDINLQNPKTDLPIAIDGAPSGMAADAHGMVYVAVGDRDEIAVLDTRVMRIVTTWQLDSSLAPHSVVLDSVHSRLFIGCRTKLLVLSATDGHQLADLLVTGPRAGVRPGGAAFFNGCLYVASEGESLAVIGQDAQGRFVVQNHIATAPDTFTLAIDPKTGGIYVPVSDPDAANTRKGGPGIRVLLLEKK